MAKGTNVPPPPPKRTPGGCGWCVPQQQNNTTNDTHFKKLSTIARSGNMRLSTCVILSDSLWLRLAVALTVS